MKIAFAGTPAFARAQLEALLQSAHEVVAVYTQPDRPSGRGQTLHISDVKACAQEAGLPIEQPQTFRNEEAIAALKAYQPDCLIVAAYGLLLPEAVLSIPRFGCINVHASLLPRWRGASPIQQAILANDTQTGITLMRMDTGLDTGNILTAASCPIEPTDTASTLHDTLMHLGARLLKEELDSIIKHDGTPQDEKLATLAPKITKQQAQINWDQTAKALDCAIRAFMPWPIAYTRIENTVVRVMQARVVSTEKKAAPGTIVAHSKAGIVVATQQGSLELTQGQLPGKKCLPFSDILNARKTLFAPGKQFEAPHGIC